MASVEHLEARTSFFFHHFRHFNITRSKAENSKSGDIYAYDDDNNIARQTNHFIPSACARNISPMEYAHAKQLVLTN